MLKSHNSMGLMCYISFELIMPYSQRCVGANQISDLSKDKLTISVVKVDPGVV